MSNLVPEPRVNKNGVTVIKHVRPDGPDVAAAHKSLPVPTVAAPPVVETERALPDYDAAIQRSISFLNSSEENVPMTRRDLEAYGELLGYAAKRDYDGYDRVWYTGQLIKHGNTGAIKTLLAHIEGLDEGADDYVKVFDSWSYGCDAGVFEQGKDYSAHPEDLRYFNFVVKTFEEVEYHTPMSEANNETIRQVASVYHELEGNVDAKDLAEYWEDRGDIDDFVENAKEHGALRSGSL